MSWARGRLGVIVGRVLEPVSFVQKASEPTREERIVTVQHVRLELIDRDENH